MNDKTRNGRRSPGEQAMKQAHNTFIYLISELAKIVATAIGIGIAALTVVAPPLLAGVLVAEQIGLTESQAIIVAAAAFVVWLSTWPPAAMGIITYFKAHFEAKCPVDEWQPLADRLHEKGGIPERRAKVVALEFSGHTYQEICDKLELADREEVTEHLANYDGDREEAEWLSENGPEV